MKESTPFCEDEKFLFFTTMQAALRIHDMGGSKEDFVKWCEGIWETLLLNDKEHLRKVLLDAMAMQVLQSIKDK